MNPKIQAAVLITQLFSGWCFCRVFIPYFRKIKTGKFDFYIGDRFKQDGSEPKFAGICLMLTFLIGLGVGLGAGLEINIGFIICVVIYGTGLLSLGVREDFLREKGSSIGVKKSHKWLIEFLLSLSILLLAKYLGLGSTLVLLPFRLGYLNLGYFYYPVTAIFMTIGINFAEIHDCPNGVTSKGVDGLCSMSGFICSLGFSAAFSLAQGCGAAWLIAVAISGGTAAILLWSLSPSKLYLGQSGSILLGGLLAVTAVLSGYHLVFLMSAIGFIIDGICAVLQRVIFIKYKKLLFKGAALHEHLKNSGKSDYTVMAVFALLGILGTAAACAFIMYAQKIQI